MIVERLDQGWVLRGPAGPPVPEETQVVVVNGIGVPLSGRLLLRRVTFDGSVQAGGCLAVQVPPGATVALQVPGVLGRPLDPTAELLVAEVMTQGGGLRAVHLFAAEADLAYRPRPLRTRVRRSREGCTVTVTATSFACDITLRAEDAGAGSGGRAPVGGVCLLAGESYTFRVRGGRGLDVRALTGPRVLRCANDQGADRSCPGRVLGTPC